MLSDKAQLALLDIRHNILAARRFSAGLSFDRFKTLDMQIMGIGNVLRHDYDNVVETIVWETVHKHLAPLLEVVVAEIEAFDSKS